MLNIGFTILISISIIPRNPANEIADIRIDLAYCETITVFFGTVSSGERIKPNKRPFMT